MSEQKKYTVTVSEIRTYLYSLEHEKQKTMAKAMHEYKMYCNANNTKVKKRELAKIEKNTEKQYSGKIKIADEIIELLDEIKEIPKDIEKLEIVEYMLYRVDVRRAEKIVNKATKKLGKRYKEIQEEIEHQIDEFPVFDRIDNINYSEYSTTGDNLANAKEQYKLEYTKEERDKLIEKELGIIDKVIQFNSVPIPHEILKNSDRDIQSKMQKFNSIRQKRIKVLTSMKEDYKKLVEPREILNIIDEAIKSIETVQEILTKTEYNSVKSILIKIRKRIYRSTSDIRGVIEAKEKRTGIANFNIQEARYLRMEKLRNTITEAANLIRANPITQVEEQLEKLKISYEREKQFASVIEKLNSSNTGDANTEVRAYEEQISSLEYKLANSKRIVQESEQNIKNSKGELLVLWKMEINSAVCKKREILELGAPNTKSTVSKLDRKNRCK